MKFSLAYFLCAIGIGFIVCLKPSAMTELGDASSQHSMFNLLVLLWIPISILALIGFRKTIFYWSSPGLYLALCELIFFHSMRNRVRYGSALDLESQSTVVFGIVFVLMNILLVYFECRRRLNKESQ